MPVLAFTGGNKFGDDVLAIAYKVQYQKSNRVHLASLFNWTRT